MNLKIKKITRRVMLIGLILYIIYDIFAMILGGTTATLSYQLWLMGKKFMFLFFALGTLVSHWSAPLLKFIKKLKIFRHIIWIGISVVFLIWSIKTYPIAPIHAFLCLLLGIINGMAWSIDRKE